MKIEIFFCANRYAKTLTSNTLEFTQLAQLFSQPFVSDEKDGSGMFPGHYKYPYRQLQNIDYHNFIILDIDDNNESEKLLNLVRHQNEYLYKFNFIIYSTFSSKSNNLRLRLILEVDINEIDDNSIITIDDYPAATRTVEATLGIISDPSSHKRNSFVYTPRIPPHTEFIFYSNLDAEPFRKTDIKKNGITFQIQRAMILSILSLIAIILFITQRKFQRNSSWQCLAALTLMLNTIRGLKF